MNEWTVGLRCWALRKPYFITEGRYGVMADSEKSARLEALIRLFNDAPGLARKCNSHELSLEFFNTYPRPYQGPEGLPGIQARVQSA